MCMKVNVLGDDVDDCVRICMKACRAKGPCLDNFIGTIVCDEKDSWKEELSFCKEKRIRIKEREDIGAVQKNNYKNIVIVLESPHTEEFKDLNFRAPALGMTGCYLQNCFHQIVEPFLDKNCSYNIILMNAIQLQCSLGQDTKLFRDELWCELWFQSDENNKRAEFIKRLADYKPNVIINACTIGAHCENGDIRSKKEKVPNLAFLESLGICKKTITEQMKNVNWQSKYCLRGYVQSAINEKYPNNDVEKLYISHPSSWRYDKNRKLKEYHAE